MRKISLFLIIIFCWGVIFYNNTVFGQQIEERKNNYYIVAYYFHGNFRCYSCYRIEQLSKEAIEHYFKNELDSGKLIFKAINVEEKGNEHFIQDYQLYTKSLIISLVKNGKEVEFHNLTRVWEFLGNKQRFFEYVRDEVSKYLKELE